MKRRKIDVEVKISVVLEGLKGKVSVFELCRKHQISEFLYYRWRDQFLEGGRAALSNGSSDRTKHRERFEVHYHE